MQLLALFIRLPTREGTGRMRAWRVLKTLGCGALRDGVYLLPVTYEHATALEAVAAETIAAQGSADIYQLETRNERQEAAVRALFDRADEYAAIAQELRALEAEAVTGDAVAQARRLQALTRRFQQVARVDFFPGEALRQTQALLDAVRQAVVRGEPTARDADMPRLDRADYRGRTWATRRRPWVDRLASAWLIRRHIDPHAAIVWLESPADCQPDWLGFDFDGATFSHVGARVTFETLLAAFALGEEPALRRMAALVHFLDVGGLPVLEAAGVEALLGGMRIAFDDDDALLADASKVFDWLINSYEETHGE